MTLDPTQILLIALAVTFVEKWAFIVLYLRGQRAPSFPIPPIPVTPIPPVGPVIVPPVESPPVAVPPVVVTPPVIPPVKPAVVVPPVIPPVIPSVVIPPVVPPVTIPVGSDFSRCLAVTLKWEGGNDDDPDDSGGRTSRGITGRDWAAWQNTHPGLDLPADVWKAPQDQIIAIYKHRYWDPLFCDSMPNGVDMVVFDHGVLAGIGTSAKLLQRIVGTNVDGEIGPLTIAAAAAIDPVSLVGKFCDARLDYYQSLNRPKYIKGWTNRVVDVRKEALALAAEAPRPKAMKLPPAANIPVPVTGGTVLQHNVWPTQAECPSFYGATEGAIRAHLVSVHVPWLMNGKSQTIQIHQKCSASLNRVLNYIWEQCGKSQEKIHEFGYDIFDGSFNWRFIAGTHTPSVHSYGAAVDFDAAANPIRNPGKFKPESLIVTAFTQENWIWLGPTFDPMHFQAARVR